MIFMTYVCVCMFVYSLLILFVSELFMSLYFCFQFARSMRRDRTRVYSVLVHTDTFQLKFETQVNACHARNAHAPLKSLWRRETVINALRKYV